MGGMRETTGLSVWDVWRHMVLPLTVLVLHATAYLYMIMRSTVRQTFREDYVITAISKGLKPKRVQLRHVLLNAFPPYAVASAMVTEAGVSFLGLGDPRCKSWAPCCTRRLRTEGC